MAPFVPRTRAAAAIRMTKIALQNQSRTIRRLRAKLATERRESAARKNGLEDKVSSLERELELQRCNNHTVTLYHKDIDHRISQLGLQEDNVVPFDDEWEEEPEEEGIEKIPVGEGEIVEE
ncbi:pleiotropic drug resistance protein 3-like [Dorcoceras hygrometricum]|uniref:Pleiotropic drug resistance protein 3-like n=1 Tax=Dorcoceras hygrometricum TaxID=472368 RepID=A0A2Z7BAE5_9LAMI|nr:pleiotropic drug resistance protein 3-like [Dorcoceras hygrometricum]